MSVPIAWHLGFDPNSLRWVVRLTDEAYWEVALVDHLGNASAVLGVDRAVTVDSMDAEEEFARAVAGTLQGVQPDDVEVLS